MLPKDPYRCLMPYPWADVPHAVQGPLTGLTFAVKDLYDIKGYPTSAGSPHRLAMSGIKRKTAPAVAALLKAGARFVGKVITDELAFSMNGNNAHFGAPINPAAPDRITGGSSSGSAAAVAGRLADIALGSDTGGSVRAPASYCGLFGIRPTHGRIDDAGVHPLSPSCDTVGWFARDGKTFARVAPVLMRGADTVKLPGKPRYLIATDLMAQAMDEARPVLDDVVRRIGLTLGEAEPVSVAGDIEELYWAFRHIQGREAWVTDGEMIDRYHPPLGPGVAGRFQFSKGVTAKQYKDGLAVRKRLTKSLGKLLGSDGVLILPSVPDIAPLAAASEAELETFRNRAINMLCVSGLTGFPQVSVPATRRNGAPLGLSVLGPAGSDRSLIDIAVAVEAAGRIRIA
jgi:amidase